MGCASSSPLVAANGGILDAAKGAANDAVHAGQDKINDVKDTLTETLNETVVQVKGAVVGAAQNIGQGLDQAIHGKRLPPLNRGNSKENETNTEEDANKQNDSEWTHIPLKESADEISSKALVGMSDVINTKSKEFSDEAEKMTDDLMKETEDVLSDTVNKLSTTVNEAIKTDSPAHSVDSLKTSSPEPEIEQAFANDELTQPPTPIPTLSELENLQSDLMSNDDSKGFLGVPPLDLSKEQMGHSTESMDSFENLIVSFENHNEKVIYSIEIVNENIDNGSRASNMENILEETEAQILNDDKRSICDGIDNLELTQISDDANNTDSSRSNSIALDEKDFDFDTNDNNKFSASNHIIHFIEDVKIEKSMENIDIDTETIANVELPTDMNTDKIESEPNDNFAIKMEENSNQELPSETAWEKMADATVKLPVHQIHAYQERTEIVTSGKWASVDNLLEICTRKESLD